MFLSDSFRIVSVTKNHTFLLYKTTYILTFVKYLIKMGFKYFYEANIFKPKIFFIDQSQK